MPIRQADQMSPELPTPQVSVVLPTVNERENLPSVIDEIHRALQSVAHEIIVVDDRSTDGTWQWVEEAARHDHALRVVCRTGEPDLSQAVLEGFQAARAQRWIVMDADGQHDPGILPALVDALQTHDLVVASRYLPGAHVEIRTLPRRLVSRLTQWSAQAALGVTLSDPMAGFFGIRRTAYEAVAERLNPRGYKILLELYVRLSQHVRPRPVSCLEIPCRFRPRRRGRSKANIRVALQYLAMLLKLRRRGL